MPTSIYTPPSPPISLTLSLALPYNPPYSQGDYCSHEGKIWKAKTSISSGASWSSASWDEVVITNELSLIVYSSTEPSNPTEGMIWLKPEEV